MKQNIRSIILIILLSSAVLLPVLMGAGIIDLPAQGNFTDSDDFSIIANFSIDWITIPIHQLPMLFRFGISIFVLFVVYLGGRSKARRFNDRTIDHVNVLKANVLKTALLIRGAVFNFSFLILLFGNKIITQSVFFSLLKNPYRRRY